MRKRRMQRLGIALILVVGLLGPPGLSAAKTRGTGPASIEVIATGLRNPRGIAFGPDHALYVAESGRGGAGPCTDHPILGRACLGRSGSITRIANGRQTRVVRGLPSIAGPAEALGPHDVAPVGGGKVYVTVGLAGSPGPQLRAQFGPEGRRLGHVLAANTRTGGRRSLADLVAFEARVNPAGGPVDSNPFGILREGNTTFVADAGGNSLLRIGPRGGVSTVAVFPDRLVRFGEERIPMNAVPTTVVRGPDGALYVGQLTGFPFPIGGARIFRVVPGERPTVYARGFTNIIDIAFAPNGRLYVLEIAHNSLLGQPPEGALIKVGRSGNKRIVADGMFFPGGLAIGSRGKLYVTNCGVCPADGEVWRITP